ncbi:ABC transporter permease subunit [Modestobacter sp. I12A-02628]|uniref:ABC transporter permease n=1 Tax=Goekera deserti TaxID=2497753 RepID=A0A7K3WCC9_9ACTN|nr:ABC transporter permease [Goekera deserti]MPQ98548.1 ABC transporter permease subunit [Goekera deserti]NDI49081.1 ABC transporter permease subunit [Goekera deserti]NEL54128.1 ABC transporter permease [Goekera deserti]
MFFFTIRRVVSSVFVLLASSLLVFALCAASFDPLARERIRQPPPTAEYLASRAEALGLNDPFFQRYWDWLSGVVRGDFGTTVNGTEVADQLGGRILVTGRMIVLAIVVAVLLAMVVGVIGAVRQYKPSDYAFTFLAYLLIALPTFWFAAILKEFVAGGVNDLFGKRLLYTIGEQSPGISATGADAWTIWTDRLGHLVLPTLSLALLSFAAWSRFQRSAMLDVLGSDYMRLARAKGLSYRRTVWKHGLRNALIPLTTVVALGVGTLFGGAVITEQVFVWNGMGRYLLQDGIGDGDINVVLGWLLVSAVFVVLFNLIADILYAVLDPRIRLA